MMSAIIGVTGEAKLASTRVFSFWSKYDITDDCQESFRNRASASKVAAPGFPRSRG